MTPSGKLPAPQHGLLLTHFLTVRDPDGYLIEVGRSTGLLRGIQAEAPAESG